MGGGALPILTWPRPADAQIIQTRLRGAPGVPVAGAIVVLEDSTGREVARTLTDSTGRVEFTPGPGVYRFHVLRIGFTRWQSPRLRLEAGTRYTTPIEPPATPIVLAGLNVEAMTTCRVEPVEGSAAAILWEEVHKALEATDWTTSHRTYRFRTTWYTRVWDPTEQVITSESRRDDAGFPSWPFTSLEAESLSVRGYVQLDAKGVLHYYGPDLAVLFSDVFLHDHCFRARRGRGAADSLIELAFEPVSSRERVSEIAGVLRLDERSARLRELEFRYTNLGRWAEDRARGLMQFEQLPTGAWVIRRWFIRAPIPKVAAFTRDTLGIGGISEDGAQVTAVLTPAGLPIVAYPLEP